MDDAGLLASPPSSPSVLATTADDGVEDRDTSDYRILTRVLAHSSSVTGLQFDERSGRRWVVSGGNDGRVQLWEVDDGRAPRPRSRFRGIGVGDQARGAGDAAGNRSGEMRLVRDLTEPCEGLWKVAFRGDLAVICCLRGGRTVLEIWSFKPVEGDL